MNYPVMKLSLASMLRAAYARYRGNAALVDGERRFTYAEVGRAACRFGRALYRLGAQQGDKVVLLDYNSADWFIAEHGLLLAGMVRVGLNWRLHPEEQAYIINDSGATVVCVGGDFVDNIQSIRHRLPNVRAVVAFRNPKGDMHNFWHLIWEQSDEDLQVDIASTDHAIFLYTSGTTGKPKGAALSHWSWIAMLRNVMVELPSVRHDDVVLHTAPITHFSGVFSTPAMSRGAKQIILPAFEAQQVLETIQQERVTMLPLVPAQINVLVTHPKIRQYDLSSIRVILYGASPIAPERLRQALEVFSPVFIQFYGLSEVPMPLTCLRMEEHVVEGTPEELRRLGSAGRPTPFVELKIVDPNDGKLEMPLGEPGEIVARGDILITGYWQQKEATAAMIESEGWAHTGDIGFMDEDGYVYIVDRRNDMIVSGGFNIYPREIEDVLYQHPGVQEAAVVGLPHERWGEAVHAVVVAKPGHRLTEEKIIEFCRQRIASYKKPQSVEFVEEIPKTPTGKVMRRALREKYWAGYERRVHG